RRQVERLAGWAAGRDEREDCGDAAYTLTVGRRHMGRRVAVVAREMGELRRKLEAWLRGEGAASEAAEGEVEAGGRRESGWKRREAGARLERCRGGAWDEESVGVLRDLYAEGYEEGYERMYEGGGYGRVSLPTYEFAEERYWVDEASSRSAVEALTLPAVEGRLQKMVERRLLHPLVHSNESTFHEQRFSAMFTGEEFFFAAHQIGGKRILPAAAYVEMVREAASRSLVVSGETADTCVVFSRLTWIKPIAYAGEDVNVSVRLTPQDSGAGFEVYTGGTNDDAVTHCNGVVELSPGQPAPQIDLDSLKASCAEQLMSPDEYYALYEQAGVVYGEGFRGISALFQGRGQRGEPLVLAKLSLPHAVSHTGPEFYLHPSLLDAALQSSLGLLHRQGSARAIIPFAADEIEVYRRTAPSMWAVVSRQSGDAEGDALLKVDVTVCDEGGEVCARLKGFSFRVLDLAQADRPDVLMTRRVWLRNDLRSDNPTRHARHVVVMCGLDIPLQGMNAVYWKPEGAAHQQYLSLALRLLNELQALSESNSKDESLVQLVVPASGGGSLWGGLAGMLTTVRLESPRLIGQVIEVDNAQSGEHLSELLRQNGNRPEDTRIRYEGGERLTPSWKELETAAGVRAPWKDEGVYLITGGAGGLGLLFSAEIATKASAPTLYLIGRSALDEEGQRKLGSLEESGARVIYRPVDVADRAGVNTLIEEIERRHHTLNGVIHAAGITHDGLMLGKRPAELREVFAAKVAGTENLDEATKHLPLDLFVLCSSITSELGNPGQGDYAAANAFMDGFARLRNQLVARGVRRGRTLSVNWPLWREGGMNLTPHAAKALFERFGMMPMETEDGLAALYAALASDESQVLVMGGEPRRMRKALLADAPTAGLNERPVSALNVEDDEALSDYVLRIVSRILDVDAHELDMNSDFEELGLDRQGLHQVFVSLSERLPIQDSYADFFEQRTLRSLIQLLRQASGERHEPASDEPAPTNVEPAADAESGVKLELAQQLVRAVLSKTTQIEIGRIEPNADFNAYGLDSLMIIQMTDTLEKTFGPLSKTLFFEYRTARQLAAHLADIGGAQLLASTRREAASTLKPAPAAGPSREVTSQPVAVSEAKQPPLVPAEGGDDRRAIDSVQTGGDDDIAIIGVAGRYPQAPDLHRLWLNLRAGRDCVTEVPASRWDHARFFD
ncbi:MAG TPA: SDR family NAD(P)-dependent oxidoreductase, partial [Pyrinomonadaceae bacterium]